MRSGLQPLCQIQRRRHQRATPASLLSRQHLQQHIPRRVARRERIVVALLGGDNDLGALLREVVWVRDAVLRPGLADRMPPCESVGEGVSSGHGQVKRGYAHMNGRPSIKDLSPLRKLSVVSRAVGRSKLRPVGIRSAAYQAAGGSALNPPVRGPMIGLITVLGESDDDARWVVEAKGWRGEGVACIRSVTVLMVGQLLTVPELGQDLLRVVEAFLQRVVSRGTAPAEGASPHRMYRPIDRIRHIWRNEQLVARHRRDRAHSVAEVAVRRWSARLSLGPHATIPPTA